MSEKVRDFGFLKCGFAKIVMFWGEKAVKSAFLMRFC